MWGNQLQSNAKSLSPARGPAASWLRRGREYVPLRRATSRNAPPPAARTTRPCDCKTVCAPSPRRTGRAPRRSSRRTGLTAIFGSLAGRIAVALLLSSLESPNEALAPNRDRIDAVELIGEPPHAWIVRRIAEPTEGDVGPGRLTATFRMHAGLVAPWDGGRALGKGMQDRTPHPLLRRHA